MRVAGLFVVLAWALAAHPVLGQEVGAGRLTATAYVPLPADRRIAVEPPDLSETSQQLADAFAAGLASRGYIVDPNAPTVLSFQADDVFSEAPERRPVELEAYANNFGYRDKVQLTWRLPFEEDVGRESRVFTYSLQAFVNTRGGERRWFGEASAVADKGRGLATALALVPILLDSLGETAKGRNFNL